MLAAFGLPGRVTSYGPVDGGWSNDVLRLVTTEGAWSVKVVRNPWGEPRWREWLDEGLRLELAAIRAGVAAPDPVLVDGLAVLDVPVQDEDAVPVTGPDAVPAPGPDAVPVTGGATVPVRVHRWVEGSTVPREPVSADLGLWVGATVARLHALALRPTSPDLYAGRVGLTTADHWPALVERAVSVGASWATQLAGSEDLARRASRLLEPWDDADCVLVHGDLDQKNLLVGVDGPVLLDWDVVLPTVPSHDLAHAALTMASWREPAVARAVLDGYSAFCGRQSGGGAAVAGERPSLAPSDLGPALASRLGWIRFTVDRAIDAGPPHALDLDALLTDLERRVTLAEHLDDWLRT